MDFGFSYTPEQETFREEVREWLRANVPPEINNRPSSRDESLQYYIQRRELGRKLGERGWLFPSAPKEYGGGGLDFDSVIILEEEAYAVGITLPPYYDSGGRLGSASIRVWGTDEQKRTFLPPIYTGAVRTWQLLTEPGAGSDLAGVRMAAIRDGNEYVLNGQKIFVGSAHGADRIWMIAMTDPAGKRHQNLSWFMIDANLPGITVQPQYLLSDSGEGSADIGHKNTVFFEDVRVPAFARIGEENDGWRVASTHLELEHGGLGDLLHYPILGRLLEYCKKTPRDGKPLIEDPAVRLRLAEVFSRYEVLRLFGVRNFWMSYSGAKMTYEGSQQSYTRKVTGLWLTKAILDIVGPGALTNDAIWGAMDGFAESQQRAGIVDIHPAGTTDVQRLIIARRLGIGNRTREEAGRVLR